MPAPPLQPARLRRIAAVAACFFLCVGGGTPSGAETVLLRTGGMLSGRIEVRTDRVLVESEGTTIRLERDAVAHVAESPLAVYDWRRAQLPGEHATADEHLRLADWAMRHAMWPQAALELLDARRIAPDSPRVAMLDRRFAELTRPRAEATPIPVTQPTPPQATSEEPPLPPALVGRFVRDVQPLVLNSCAAGGCHGVGVNGDAETPFQLDRAPLHGRGQSVATLRNLRSVLAAVDPNDPANSKLLVAARGPHAGVTPVDGRLRDRQLARLAAWAHAAAAEVGPSSDVRQASAEIAAPIDTPANADSESEDADAGPRDEFDPAIFNRRFRRAEDDAE